MASVKAYVSDRAKKYLATVEGRRMLLLYIVEGGKLAPPPEPGTSSESTPGGVSTKPAK
jgi:hypothetical protein